jgi:tetratricopeptide (TPR) repeat protein
MLDTILPVVAGTIAATLALSLLALRAEFSGKRYGLAIARKWIATGWRSSALVIGGLVAGAALGFSQVRSSPPSQSDSTSVANYLGSAPSSQSQNVETQSGEVPDQAQASLRAYLDRVSAKNRATPNMTPIPDEATAGGDAELPAVDTMITRLALRLESEPGDADGWKMLGWAYLNTGQFQDSIKAYEHALALKAGDGEIEKGLADARAKATQPEVTAALVKIPQTAAPPGLSPDDIKSAEGLSGEQRSTMIRAMVDRLANRLETAPRDEDGWVRLMRARMVLGEKDAAKAALTKALETFGTDSTVKNRISASAKELGVDSN